MDSILRQNAQKERDVAQSQNAHTEIPHTWEHVQDEYSPNQPELPQEEIKKKKSFFFKFSVVAFLIFILAAGFAASQWLSSKNAISTVNIVVSPSLIEYAPSGETLNQNLSISNNNAVAIDNVVVTVSYVRGEDYQGNRDVVREEYRLDTIAAGTLRSINTPFLFYGQEGDIRAVAYEMTYTVAGSNATFSKSPIHRDVTIAAPAVLLNIQGANRIIADHEYAFTVTVKNVRQEGFTPSILNIEIPTGFRICNNCSGSLSTNNVRIDDLPIGTEKTFSVVGKFENSVNAERYFRVYLSTQNGDSVGNTFASTELGISVVPPPIAITLALADTHTTRLRAILTNTGGSALDNITVDVKSSTGEVFAFNNTTHPSLARVAPSSPVELDLIPTNITSGQMKFTFKVYGVERNQSFDTVLLREIELPITLR